VTKIAFGVSLKDIQDIDLIMKNNDYESIGSMIRVLVKNRAFIEKIKNDYKEIKVIGKSHVHEEREIEQN
jgi:hypothetical protein